MTNLVAMIVLMLLNSSVVSDVMLFCVKNAMTPTIDGSIFILLIVGSLFLCALLDWVTRKERDIF